MRNTMFDMMEKSRHFNIAWRKVLEILDRSVLDRRHVEIAGGNIGHRGQSKNCCAHI